MSYLVGQNGHYVTLEEYLRKHNPEYWQASQDNGTMEFREERQWLEDCVRHYDMPRLTNDDGETIYHEIMLRLMELSTLV